MDKVMKTLECVWVVAEMAAKTSVAIAGVVFCVQSALLGLKGEEFDQRLMYGMVMMAHLTIWDRREEKCNDS